jgi:hypothetical protein
MTTTPQLIDALVERAAPVARLRAPLVRACRWLGFAIVVLALLTAMHGMRSDLLLHLRQPEFLVSLAAALVTGALAAIAAFMISIPDRSWWWALLPAPALAVWLSTIGYGCLTDWVSMDPAGVHWGETARCFVTLLLTSTPLALVMLVMLRHAVLVRTRVVTGLAALGVAALTAFALALDHDLDATVMILIWNLGTAALITAVGGLFGGRMLRWLA